MTAFDFGSAFVVRYLLHRREADQLAPSHRPACHDGDRNAHEKDLRADEIQQVVTLAGDNQGAWRVAVIFTPIAIRSGRAASAASIPL
jgi:hypothetical protein